MVTGKQGHLYYEIPCCAMWREDNNYIYFRNTYGAYLLQINMVLTFQDFAGNILEVVQIQPTSEVGEITIRLRPYLLAYTPCKVCVDIPVAHIYDINGKMDTVDKLNWCFNCFFGKTFQERQHGSSRIITLPSDYPLMTRGLDVFKPQCWEGTINFGGVGQLENSPCANVVTLKPLTSDNRVLFTSSACSIAGEVTSELAACNYSIEVRQICPRRNGIAIYYYDTDGCMRCAVGEVLEKKMAVTRDKYVRGGVVYNRQPHSMFTDYDGTISVGFSDVDPLQYIEDILFTPRAWVNGVRKNCADCSDEEVEYEVIPTTLTLTRDGRTKDIIINFLIDD